jgi:hypothetical protein
MNNPASTDNLVLDIGGDTGALIIHTAAHRDQAEIEISPAGPGRARARNVPGTDGVPRTGNVPGTDNVPGTGNVPRTDNVPGTDNVPRTHNVVRRREAAGGVRYAAVFPSVAAGDYVVWRDDDTPAGTVTVRGGAVASFRFDQVLPERPTPLARPPDAAVKTLPRQPRGRPGRR